MQIEILASFAGIDVKRSPASYVRMRYLLGWNYGIDVSIVYALSNGVRFGFQRLFKYRQFGKSCYASRHYNQRMLGINVEKNGFRRNPFFTNLYIILEELKLIQND